ncbi:MAG: hypothetical protein DRI61_00855 [Chloroflexi bacterium]|nr:MAG: hypothetical protein DRI61_00855 [Chloroflexota bacterium]
MSKKKLKKFRKRFDKIVDKCLDQLEQLFKDYKVEDVEDYLDQILCNFEFIEMEIESKLSSSKTTNTQSTVYYCSSGNSTTSLKKVSEQVSIIE